MDQAGGNTEIVEYGYKPAILGGAWTFRLEPDALVWSIGSASGRVAYKDIRRIRLGFRPATMQSYRFLTEIWADRAPKLPIASSSWKSIMEQERLDEAYSGFVVALHRKIAAAQGAPRLRAGALPFLYWPGLVIFIGICGATCWLMCRALQHGDTGAILFLLGFFAFLLWQLGRFFKRNLPRAYSLDAIPPDVLPRP